MSEHTIRTTCSYCSVGCSLDVTVENGEFKRLRPTRDYPVNLGKSCPKGYHLMPPFAAEDRAVRPLIRREGSLEPTDWDTALRTFTERLKDILERHGRESVAFLSTGQIPTEEMALLGAVAKFGMGLVHGDGNTRQCMATAAVAYKQAFGFDAPPFAYRDFELSDLLVFIGANPTISHPVMWNRVKRNERDAEIVVIDPRRTKTAESADLHLAIEPKTDMVLLYGLAHLLIERGWIDRPFIDSHTEGFEDLRSHVASYTPELTARETGLPAGRIEQLAEMIHTARAASFWWTMGVNQGHQAVRTAQAVIDLALITGNIGRPGTGPNSITGQANAMGSRLFSNTTSLPAGYDFRNPDHRAKVAGILGIDVSAIPDKQSLPYHRILEEVDRGTIRALWIIATNPVHSWVDKNSLERLCEKLEFLVVQDIYTSTETARMADLVLPAAGSGEKSGTFINSERRIGIVQKAVDPPGEALSDFAIFRRIAESWGCSDMFREWSSPEAVFQILQRLSAGRPCDITGIGGYRMILERGGVQWPYPAHEPPEGAERRLFEDGRFYTGSGRARILVEDIVPPPERPDESYPHILLTGRGTVAQWHTQTRTGKVEMLRNLSPAEPYVEVSEQDAHELSLEEGAAVRVVSRRGAVTVELRISPSLRPGQIFMPMHYFETNKLTYPAFDPYSGEPAYKYAAVRIEPVGNDERRTR